MNLPSLGIDTTKPFAEARAPGVGSLLDRIRSDQDKSGTVQYLRRERKLLIQDDTKRPSAGAEPPPALIYEYGTLAQILGGLFRAGELIGWISMHENRSTRVWTQAEAAAMEGAVARVLRALGDQS